MDKKLTDVTDNNVGKMNDNEIIKALKTLLELVLVEGCLQRAKTISLALDLINRLEKKNSNLTSDLTSLQNDLTSLQAENKRLSTLAELGEMRANDYRVMRDRALKAEAENESKQATIDSFADIGKLYSEIKAEAYKEFAELVHCHCQSIINQPHNEKVKPLSWKVAYEEFDEYVDNLLKELVGEDNG